MEARSFVIMASGRGSNAKCLAAAAKKFDLNLKGLVCDQKDALVIKEMKDMEVPCWVVPAPTGPKSEKRFKHEELILEVIKKNVSDTNNLWIFLAGYQRILSHHFLNFFFDDQLGVNRIVNIHPALLPHFPGNRGVEQAYAARADESGCTIHFVDEGVDTGPIIMQKKFKRNDDWDLEEFRKKGLSVEHEIYPRVLKNIMLNDSFLQRVEVIPPEAGNDLNKAIDKTTGKIVKIPFFKLSLKKIPSLCRVEELFFDPVCERIMLPGDPLPGRPNFVVEVGFLPGVTDNTGKSAREALELTGGDGRVFSGNLYLIFDDRADIDTIKKKAKTHWANPLIQKIKVYTLSEFESLDRFNDIELPLVKIEKKHAQEQVDLNIRDEELIDLSKRQGWALNLKEMQGIKSYFSNRTPTRLEMEVIAQTWSEHCKHKIFAAKIAYSESGDHPYRKLGTHVVDGLYPQLIKRSTYELEQEGKVDWTRSVFKDNGGIVRFDSLVDLCIKVETHNAPSALDPYGGALTGILGVNRDILGCGLGGRPIANLDVFCVGHLDGGEDEKLMPKDVRPPREILQGVHHGVQDGGNKSGIPTVNGSIVFDQDYCGRPLVFCGTVGVLPQRLADGREGSSKTPQRGDYIVMIGGAVGADGIHGATFSSLELASNAPSSAVQIGDPLTQKRMLDFIVAARGLYSCITDNGAGGLSSSVGEMATFTGGATIDLKHCPLKYQGLAPWEIMVSESQERMTLAVPPSRQKEFFELAKSFGVMAVILGEMTETGFLEVFYGKDLVGKLALNFLHEGVPRMDLKASWDGPKKRSFLDERKVEIRELGLERVLPLLLGRENVASKRYWVEQYDHEVMASTCVGPFVGKVPLDGAVIWLKPHGGSDTGAIALGHGLCPRLSLEDPYLMAQYAVDEAVRNIVAVGADWEYICLLDNFCWPNPVSDFEHYKLGQLVRSCYGLYDICKSYGFPLVSGKDSMKNDFKGENQEGDFIELSILPTLLVTAMGKVDIRNTINSEFQGEGDWVYRLGGKKEGTLLGSELAEMASDLSREELKSLDALKLKENMAVYRCLHRLIGKKLIQSCHDISDGGLLCALCEGTFNQNYGLDIALKTDYLWNSLFHEGPGRFVVSVKSQCVEEFELLAKDLPFEHLGHVNKGENINLKTNYGEWSWKVSDLAKAFDRIW